MRTLQGSLRWSRLVAGIVLTYGAVADALAHQRSQESKLPEEVGGLLMNKSFTVRYALLDTLQQSRYLLERGLPSLESSHCLAETYLAPALLAADFIQVLPNYVVYTDDNTHSAARSWMQGLQDADQSRIRLINLDADPKDPDRMRPFIELGLDATNLISVRRTLADGEHLSTATSRLLLGTDVSFQSEPKAFLAAASKLSSRQAIYMIDDTAFKGKLYRVANYAGQQCAGLLGDFVFLAPGADLSVSLLQEKMLWYANQNKDAQRITPFCRSCENERISNRLHGIDQWALAMALGNATTVDDARGCYALPSTLYHNGAHSRRKPGLEAVHDKHITSRLCGYNGVHTGQ